MLRRIIAPFLCCIVICSAEADDDVLLTPDEAFPLAADLENGQTLRLSWDIAQHYYLYRKNFKFVSRTAGIETQEAVFPAGQNHQDKQFGNVEIYRDRLEVDLPLRRLAPSSTTLMLEVNFRGCADVGICYLPVSKFLAIDLPATPPRQAIEIIYTSSAPTPAL